MIGSRLVVGSEGRTLAKQIEIASSYWQQLRGLIGREIESDVAILFPYCRQVHTAFMAYPIDVAFCKPHTSQEWEVINVVTLSPWRLSPYVRDATLAIEMRAGRLAPYLPIGTLIQSLT